MNIVFHIFSNICCRYTLELPHGVNSNMYLQHIIGYRSYITITKELSGNERSQ